jgi:hypothetical protein
MTDYYIATDGSDSNDGLSIGAPKATINSLQTTYNFSDADKIIFRAGTYNSALAYGPDPTIFMEFDTMTEVVSLEGYEGETVIFEPTGGDISWLVSMHNIDVTSDNTTYTVKNIQFRNSTSDVTSGFLRLEQKTSDTNIVKFIVEGCTFTQTSSEADLTGSAVYSSTAGKVDFTVKNCTFSICDEKAIRLTNQLKATVENNIVNCNPPSTNDVASSMLLFSGKQNLTETTELHVRNNTIVFNHLDGGGNCIICQPEYYNKFYICNNTITINSDNPATDGAIIDFMRPATTTTNNRSTAEFNLVGNYVKNNHGRGDFLEFYRAGEDDANVGVFNITDNHWKGNNTIRDHTTSEVLNMDHCHAAAINIKRNTFEDFQDMIVMRNSDGIPHIIEDNVFKNTGNTSGSAGATTPITVWAQDTVDTVTIKNNLFLIDEEGTCIYVSDNDNGIVEFIIEGNSFVYLGPEITDGDNLITRIALNTVDEITIRNNYYYGLEGLKSTTLFNHDSSAFPGPVNNAVADNGLFHTSNIIKRKKSGIISNMSKEIAWQV